MAPRKPKSLSGLISAAALLVTAGAVIAFLAGEVAGGRAPAPGAPKGKIPGVARTSRQGPSPVPELMGPWRAPDASPQGGTPAAPLVQAEPAPETDAAQAIMAQMKKLVSDLEYNSNRGLPEPPQMTVPPLPEPWRPPPAAQRGPPPSIERVVPARASTRGGTRITIQGKNLRATEVMFGSSPGTIVSNSETEVTVVAPAGPKGPATVAVTNGDGTYAIAGGGFSYGD